MEGLLRSSLCTSSSSMLSRATCLSSLLICRMYSSNSSNSQSTPHSKANLPTCKTFNNNLNTSSHRLSKHRMAKLQHLLSCKTFNNSSRRHKSLPSPRTNLLSCKTFSNKCSSSSSHQHRHRLRTSLLSCKIFNRDHLNEVLKF